jgi:hypothetical protein
MKGQLTAARADDAEGAYRQILENPRLIRSVQSSMLAWVAWLGDEELAIELAIASPVERGWMAVCFDGNHRGTVGSIYVYEKVPQMIEAYVRHAVSPGTAYRELVQGRYESMRVR